MCEGRVIQTATPEETYEQPASRMAAALTGPCTFVKGTVVGDHATTPLGPVAMQSTHTGTVTLALRPHALRFVPTNDGPHTITVVRYAGAFRRVVCEGPCPGIEVAYPLDAPAPTPGQIGRIDVIAPAWVLPD